MQKSTFKIAKMDCPSEEQMIRMKLADITNINSLDFDIANRKLVVFHTGKYDEIFQRLDTLKFDTSLVESIDAGEVVLPENHAQERKLLWQVLGINLFFFVLESISGIVAKSMGLVADSLDMLADSFVYGLALLQLAAHWQ
jgi:cation transport ATPase